MQKPSPGQAGGDNTSCRPPEPHVCVLLCGEVSVHFLCTSAPQVTQHGWAPLLNTVISAGWAGLSHIHRGAVTVQGRVTHTHTHTGTIYPPTRQASRMEFSQKKATPLPHQINRNTPVSHDAEESPHSSQNTSNQGCWHMPWGCSRYHRGWREQRGNGLCFRGQVLEPLASKIPVQCWWDHTEKSLHLSSSTASSVTKGKGERVRQEHPSWGLLGHPTRALGDPGQDRAGDGPVGHRRDGGKLQCETRALPAPLEQERQRKEPVECASLGKHSWWSPQTLEEMRLCKIIHCRIVLEHRGNQGTCADQCVQSLPPLLLPQWTLAAPCLAGSFPSLDPCRPSLSKLQSRQRSEDRT